MAYNADNMVQLSAGETSPDQLAAIRIYSYESLDDDIATQAAPAYFNKAADLLRWGSLIMLADNADQPELWEVSSQTGALPVTLAKFKPPTNVPSPYYETLSEAPVDFITSGGVTDIVPMADSIVGAYAVYSLNSAVNDIGPPMAHSGIEYIECLAGQVEVNWSRPVVPGQTVRLWLQIRSAAPTP